MAREKSIIAHFLVTTVMLLFFASWFSGLAFAEATDNKADQIKRFEQKIRSLQTFQIPIIDVEHHWGGKLTIEELVRKIVVVKDFYNIRV